MWNATLDRLEALDIERLLEEEAEESATLEYKQQLPSRGDDDRREFLYDISALANASGGYIVFGIADRRDEQNRPTGIAERIIGLSVDNLSSEISRLENTVRDNIAPRLSGIHFKPIDCDGGTVLVISVPKSWNAPHMVTFKQVNKFYSRVSTGKYLMNVDEIRASFSQQSILSDRMRDWREQRVGLILSGKGPVRLAPVDGISAPTLVIHVMPATAFSNAGTSASWSLTEQLRLNMFCPSTDSPGSGRYNGDGNMRWNDVAQKPFAAGYTQVFRNGLIEYVHAAIGHSTKETGLAIIGLRLEVVLIQAYRDARKTLAELGMTDPVYVAVSLLNIATWRFFISYRTFRNLPEIAETEFMSSEILVDDADLSNAPPNLKVLVDTLWQVGGREDTPFVTDEGWRPLNNWSL